MIEEKKTMFLIKERYGNYETIIEVEEFKLIIYFHGDVSLVSLSLTT